MPTETGLSRRAAVAIILRPTSAVDAELLLIKRADHEPDPWSGQIALPGGRHEPGDATMADTAVRETFEETAIDLTRSGRMLGTLDEIHPRTPTLPPIIVRPYVAVLTEPVHIVPSREVAAAFWMPVSCLLDPLLSGEETIQVRGEPRRVTCFWYAEHLVWGMTERILRQFVAYLTEAPQ